MKKGQLFLMLMRCIIISACFVGCKKAAVAPKSECKIVAFISGSNATAFTYNSDGRESAKIAATSDKFTYSGNTINISSTTGTTVNSITTVILNTNGLASNVNVTDAAGIILSNTVYEYDGTELSKSTVTGAPGSDPFVTTYTWSSENLVSSQNASDTTTYDYAPDKPAQTGDLWHTLNLQQGYENIRTKNPVTAMRSGVNTNIINYTFETDGKISGLTAISGGSVILAINYQYECK